MTRSSWKLAWAHELLSRERRDGFSLVELLTVIAIAAVMSTLAVTAFVSLKRADSLNNATAIISTLLEQARAYAMANNTYVFVGFEESDFGTPSTAAQTAGTGRVAVQAFASADGTLNLSASNLSPINRLQILDSLDLAPAITLTTGGLPGRPAADYVIGSTSFPAPSSTISSRNFTFSKVIAFDSLGLVHIPTVAPQPSLQYLEIDVQPSNGNSVPTAATNASAIQVDAMTGAVSVYRP